MADHNFVTRTDDGVTVAVHVTPKARRQCIEGVAAGPDGRPAIRVAVTAAPQDGKANTAVIALLARAWRVPKGSIAIRSGAAARRKVLSVAGDPAALADRIGHSVRDFADG